MSSPTILGFCSLDDLKRYMGIAVSETLGTDETDKLLDVIGSAEQLILEDLQIEMHPATGDLYVDVAVECATISTYPRYVRSVTTLALVDAANNVVENIASTPVSTVRRDKAGAYLYSSYSRADRRDFMPGRYKLTGAFGVSNATSYPEAFRRATCMLAKHLLDIQRTNFTLREDSGFGQTLKADAGALVIPELIRGIYKNFKFQRFA